MSDARLRVLIVDDEPLARERIRGFLRDLDDVDLVGECEDGEAAIRAISDEGPDLVFLDVQMPGRDGFAVLAALDPERLPAIVFVTAHDRYALRAFEVHALDYLLKPFDRERFEQTLARARKRLTPGEGRDGGVRALQVELRNSEDSAAPPIAVRSGGRVLLLRPGEIDYVEAAGNYVKLHARGEEYLLRETMTRIEERLGGGRFVRIHRSTIVNLSVVRELQPWFHGDYAVILLDGSRLTLSRTYRDRLRPLL